METMAESMATVSMIVVMTRSMATTMYGANDDDGDDIDEDDDDYDKHDDVDGNDGDNDGDDADDTDANCNHFFESFPPRELRASAWMLGPV
eukprot:2258011-Lingulodinium_polyedra.AAC.2